MAGLRVTLEMTASPGNVENYKVASPESLVKWQEAAKKALSEQGGFTEVEVKLDEAQASTATKAKLLINVNKVITVKAE